MNKLVAVLALALVACVVKGSPDPVPAGGGPPGPMEPTEPPSQGDADGVAVTGGAADDNQVCVPNGNCALGCPQGKCAFVCESGSTCDLSCDGGKCDVTCQSGATCNVSCNGGKCNETCLPGATCNLDCNGGKCNQSCADNSTCAASCNGGKCKN